jgi:hypothetical protein
MKHGGSQQHPAPVVHPPAPVGSCEEHEEGEEGGPWKDPEAWHSAHLIASEKPVCALGVVARRASIGSGLEEGRKRRRGLREGGGSVIPWRATSRAEGDGRVLEHHHRAEKGHHAGDQPGGEWSRVRAPQAPPPPGVDPTVTSSSPFVVRTVTRPPHPSSRTVSQLPHWGEAAARLHRSREPRGKLVQQWWRRGALVIFLRAEQQRWRGGAGGGDGDLNLDCGAPPRAGTSSSLPQAHSPPLPPDLGLRRREA